ncbi:MAG TPA: NADH-quinone oxidoreductase subunit C [Streptosporangiaceae bacterium]|nr:NADH-quinone oxidoreductase subunit C [Streptosporangiaceae bacterium]
MTALQPLPMGAAASLLTTIDGAARRGSGGAVTVDVPAAQLEAAVHHLAAAGARLADLFAADGGQVTVRLVWGLDTERQYLVTETAIHAPEYPPLSDIAPAAFTEECEIYEQFGVRPAGGKPLNRVVLPPHAGKDFPRLGHRPPQAPAEVHARHTVGGQAFEFPFGPVRQAAMESLYYGLVTSGEELVDLYLFTWHKHRGLEWRLRGRRPAEAMFLAERTEGLSATAVAWALAAAVESALGAEPPPGALLTRGIALELERLYNHAAAVAALCQAAGLSVGQAAAEIALERLLRVNAATFGHRYLFGVLDAGGVRRAPDQAALRDGLPGAYGELRRAADALLGTNSFMDRLEATGIVTTEQARRLGLVGPVARAAGVPIDCRLDQPTAPYSAHPPALAVRDAGDVLARFRVMLDEAADSVRLIGDLLAAGPGAGLTALPAGGGSGLGWAESARGEALAWVSLDAGGRITRARLRPASVRNWRGFDDAARSQNVFTDVPIIEASFWLTVAGTAR